MKIAVIGASGLIGKQLVNHFLEQKHLVVALSRNESKIERMFSSEVLIGEWNGLDVNTLLNFIDGCDAVVNLAGESIVGVPWFKGQRRKILDSRVLPSKAIVEAISQASYKPKVVLQASAIGYYKPHKTKVLDENSEDGTGFLSEVVKSWEQSISGAEKYGTRVVYLRTGVLLSMRGGALPKLVPMFNVNFGGYFGTGNQWFSWIHETDEIRAIDFLLQNADCQGAYNLVSPSPLPARFFAKALGKAMQKPSAMPIPGIFLRLIFGKMADEAMLASQQVIPSRLQTAGFEFQYSDADSALADLVKQIQP